MKNFVNANVTQYSSFSNDGYIYTDSTMDLIHSPLEWQKRGLCQTASGYGAKLTTHYKIRFENKSYRLYNTCFGNAGSTWFKVKGRQIFVN